MENNFWPYADMQEQQQNRNSMRLDILRDMKSRNIENLSGMRWDSLGVSPSALNQYNFSNEWKKINETRKIQEMKIPHDEPKAQKTRSTLWLERLIWGSELDKPREFGME